MVHGVPDLRTGPYMYVFSQAQLDDQRHEWIHSPQFVAAVEIAANAYHETECLYGIERKALWGHLDELIERWQENRRQSNLGQIQGSAVDAFHTCIVDLSALMAAAPRES